MSSVYVGKADLRDQLFIFSDKSEKELISKLAWISTICIFAGPSLTLFGLFLLFL